jgi:hypothetical protein
MLGNCGPVLSAWEAAQRPPGACVASAVTYTVHGIWVTVGINEELDQGREVVPHSKVQRRGALLWREIRINDWDLSPTPPTSLGLTGCRSREGDRAAGFGPSSISNNMGGLSPQT